MSDEIEKLREELAEANARRADLRTALEWANEERDRLQRERDEHKAKREEYAAEARSLRERLRDAYGERDQYLRERDQARLAEERARESLDELDEAIYDCLPSDDDGDTPLDCVEHAADQLRALAQERDEARAEVERLRAGEECHVARPGEGTYECRVERKCAACRLRNAEAEVKRVSKWRETWAEAYAMLESKVDTERATAFRRGAEAMREACAREAFDYMDVGGEWPSGARDLIRALPIPEER